MLTPADIAEATRRIAMAENGDNNQAPRPVPTAFPGSSPYLVTLTPHKTVDDVSLSALDINIAKLKPKSWAKDKYQRMLSPQEQIEMGGHTT